MLDRILSAWTAPRKSADELQALQLRKLQRLVRHAFSNVPFYRRRFQEAGVHPDDIRTPDDLERIPVTTRKDLQSAELSELLATGVDPNACINLYTSGSSGKPLTTYVTPWERRLRGVIEMRSLLRIGFSPRDHLVSAGPHRRRPRSLAGRLGIYRTDIIPGLMKAEEMLPLLKRLQPTIFWFYPTTFRALRMYTGGPLSQYIRPRLLISSSEVLDDLLRDQVRDEFGLDPYNFYGSIETGRIASECLAREGLHVNPDHVILETRRADRPAAEGEPGTVLVTTLNTRAMPFIRYELGDRVTRLARRCSCGSPFPLIAAPDGRQEEVILLPGGRLVQPVWCLAVLRQYRDILQLRIIQERVDHLMVLIVASKPLADHVPDEMGRQITEKLGEPVTVDVQLVDSIPEEKEKFRCFVTHLPADMLRPPAG